MQSRRWILYLGCFVSLVLWPSFASWACYYGSWDAAHYKLFEPQKEHLTQFYGFARYYRNYSESESSDGENKLIKNANLDSWQAYFGKSVRRQDVDELLYDGDAFRKYIHPNPKTGKLTYRKSGETHNRLEELWLNQQRMDELQYFDYARECEPHCVHSPDWEGKPLHPTGLVIRDSLIAKGKRLYKETRIPFLRLRYAYQIIRLEQYYGRIEQGIADFKTYAVPVLSASKEIAAWARGHYAGCLLRKKRYSEAAYQFSKMYAASPCRRNQARMSWEIRTDKDWQKLMTLCKSDAEKADNYALRALRWNSIPYEDMRMMQSLDPDREDLDMLLVREVNKLEEEFLGFHEFGSASYSQLLRNKWRVPKVRKRLHRLHGIVRENIATGNTADPDLWKMADIHLSFLNGDFSEANSKLEDLIPRLTENSLARALMMQLEYQLVNKGKITRSMEAKFSDDQLKKSQSSEEFFAFRNDALFWKYMDQGDEVKACLVKKHPLLFFRFGLRVSFVDSLLTLEMRPDKNVFEQELIDHFHERISHDRLLEIKGTTHLVHNELDSAIATFDRLSPEFKKNSRSFILDHDPFQPWALQFRKGQGIPWKKHVFTKRSFASTIHNLKRQTQVDDGKNALRYFLLGNAEFYTNSDQPAWQAKTFYVGSSHHFGYENRLWKTDASDDDSSIGFPDHLDRRKAIEYYTLSIQNTQDPELQTLAFFMLAQCGGDGPAADFPASPKRELYCDGNYDILMDHFSHTAVYDMLIRECKYFKAYASL